MNEKEIKGISKFLSLILRHHPQAINLKLDKDGWADINELINKSLSKHPALTTTLLDQIVTTNDKQRFAYNDDKTKIRANQGHSIEVNLELEPQMPPEYLYHGTVDKFIDLIKKEGLQKMSRQHVHLSKDIETAITVGSRKGKAIILKVNSGKMHNECHTFYLSANGVWLTNAVPPQFITF